MTVFGFNNRKDAENLSYFSKTMNFERGRKIGAPDGLETILVKAPSDGIDAKVSGQCSSAQCFVVHITEDGEVEDNTNEVEVWNFTEEDVEADAYISCFRFRESWVFGSGGGGGVRTFVATSAITGRSGNTAGTGTAVSYIYNDTTGDLDTGSENPPFSIVNPYTQSVSNGIVIQCKAVSGGKWEIIQAECEDTTEEDTTEEQETP